MKILFLGTGAADWEEKDWDAGRTGTRFLTTALVDGHILIDCGPTLFRSAETAGVDLSSVDTVLLTHLHDDHYSPDSLARLAALCSFTLYTEKQSASHIPAIPGMTVRPLSLFEETPVVCGTVTAVPANHRVASPAPNAPVHYVLRQGDETLFWGCDGHRLICDSWAYLRRLRFDCMVLDGTFGDAPSLPTYFEHNNIMHITEMAAIFRGVRMIKPGGRIVMCHMSRDCHDSHDVLSARMKKEGIVVAYDSMTLTLPSEETEK